MIITKKNMEDLANMALRMIEGRTRAGISADGTPFKPKADGSPSNLVDTGRMLDSLRVDYANESGFQVSANTPYAEYVAIERPFMGLLETEISELESAADKMVSKNAEDSLNELLRSTR